MILYCSFLSFKFPYFMSDMALVRRTPSTLVVSRYPTMTLPILTCFLMKRCFWEICFDLFVDLLFSFQFLSNVAFYSNTWLDVTQALHWMGCTVGFASSYIYIYIHLLLYSHIFGFLDIDIGVSEYHSTTIKLQTIIFFTVASYDFG